MTSERFYPWCVDLGENNVRGKLRAEAGSFPRAHSQKTGRRAKWQKKTGGKKEQKILGDRVRLLLLLPRRSYVISAAHANEARSCLFDLLPVFVTSPPARSNWQLSTKTCGEEAKGRVGTPKEAEPPPALALLFFFS